MRKLKLKDITVSSDSSIKNAMHLLDRGGLRLVFVIDEKKLLGIVSDSEIRKSILKGTSVSENVKNILNPNPVVLQEIQLNNQYETKMVIRKLIQKMPGSTHILLVDNQKNVKDLINISTLIKENQFPFKKNYQHNKRILVIGGAGFLGCILVPKLLKRGYKVRILDNLMYGSSHLSPILAHTNCELLEGDIRNISTLVLALSDVDAAINLAAIVGDPACKNDPESAIETNYLANKAVAETCKYFQVNRFIYASTCSVYGQMEGNDELNENSALNPVSLYAKSKIQSEEGILDLMDENFSPTILRMGTLYGYSPRMRFDLVANAMTKTAISEGKIHVHAGGKQWRPMLSVEDAAEAYIKCLEAPLEKIRGEIFNVGSEVQNYQILDIAQIIKKSFPKAQLIVEKESFDPRNYLVSFSKIQKILKFKTKHTIDSTTKQIVKAIKSGEIKNVNDAKYYNIVIDS
ncbi:MAG: NAD-dependent epimerase/dehydratase family protein [Candidatus Daviesbacteria bacterium]|nr:NAD-dependent epimerase/dehydratase family protein [Candidatus Daviesbacteria bacterium]